MEQTRITKIHKLNELYHLRHLFYEKDKIYIMKCDAWKMINTLFEKKAKLELKIIVPPPLFRVRGYRCLEDAEQAEQDYYDRFIKPRKEIEKEIEKTDQDIQDIHETIKNLEDRGRINEQEIQYHPLSFLYSVYGKKAIANFMSRC
jgi:DNA-binding transcriptional regulator GbsR (MarR family)